MRSWRHCGTTDAICGSSALGSPSLPLHGRSAGRGGLWRRTLTMLSDCPDISPQSRRHSAEEWRPSQLLTSVYELHMRLPMPFRCHGQDDQVI